ncbi:hypothetical protein BJV82DRAFT_579504 [Fennellomyces sp. T-0311]|nr:hypothetical protein BJV82DRAFT_579504 [Fennellomyces sp. T-0311]
MLRFPCNFTSRFRTRLIPYSQLSCRCYTPTPEPADSAANTVSENDPIHRVNLRVGQIVSVDQHPEASHLFIEQVNLNEDEPRTIVSGLAPYMAKESLLLQNKFVVVVSNMKPSRFRGVRSEGMLLAASKDNTVELLQPAPSSQIGERVQIDSHPSTSDPDPVLKPKQKVFETVAPFLVTNGDRLATYKGHKLVTSDGQPIRSETIANGQIS